MRIDGPITVLDEKETPIESAASQQQQKGEDDEVVSVVDFKVESTIQKVKVARLALGIGKVPRPNFDLGADLKETSRETNRLTVKYILYLDSFPAVQRVELHGTATIRSPLISSHSDEVSEGLLSEVALEIFRSHYATIYLLFDSMRLPFPSPWVVKDVHLV